MTGTFATIGGIIIDNVVTADGRIHLQQMGGNAIHSGLSARIWADNVAIVGNIPQNYPFDWINQLKQEGLNLEGVIQKPTSVSLEEWFFYDESGERQDRLYLRHKDAKALLENNKENLANDVRNLLFESAKRHHGSSEETYGTFRATYPISPCQIPETMPPIIACHLAPSSLGEHMQLANALSCKVSTISLDPGLYVETMNQEELRLLLTKINCFMPSEKEMLLLYPGETVESAIRILGRLSACSIIVKCGGDGCLVWDGSTRKLSRVPAFNTKVNDLTGAGDSFCGAFLVKFAETGNPVEAALYATATASRTIEIAGALGYLNIDRQELVQRTKSLSALELD